MRLDFVAGSINGPQRLCLEKRDLVLQLSNTSNVDVADAYKLPFASVSLASANAALRPNERTLPSARKSPLFFVIGIPVKR